MGSYVATLMVSAFLNTFPRFLTLGHAFVEVLRYYGKEFDPSCLAIHEGRKIMPKIVPGVELVVYDIFAPEVNAAASVTQFENIREVMADAYDCLCKGKQALLEGILGHAYSLYESL